MNAWLIGGAVFLGLAQFVAVAYFMKIPRKAREEYESKHSGKPE